MVQIEVPQRLIIICILTGTVLFFLTATKNMFLESVHLSIMALTTMGFEDDKIVFETARVLMSFWLLCVPVIVTVLSSYVA